MALDLAFRRARQTGTLALPHGDLVELPPEAFDLDSVVSGGKFSFSFPFPLQPRWIFEFPQRGEDEKWWESSPLVKIDLSGNKLREIPREAACWEEARSIRCPHNELIRVAPEVFQLPELKQLDLSHNKIRELSEDIGVAPSLVDFSVASNQLRALPALLTSWTRLERLVLDNNVLEVLPEDLGKLGAMVELKVSGNRLSSLPESIGSLTALQTLEVRSNRLKALPSLAGLTQLRFLDARENQLSELPHLPSSTAVDQVLLGRNSIRHLNRSVLRAAPSLGVLDLSENQIENIPEEIAHLTALHTLDLRNNNLRGLPYVLGFLPFLTRLPLEGNALRTLRRSLWSGPAGELKAYLRTRAPESELPQLEERMRFLEAVKEGRPIARDGPPGAPNAAAAGAGAGGSASPPRRRAADPVQEELASRRDGLDWRILLRDAVSAGILQVAKSQLTSLPQAMFHAGLLAEVKELRLSRNRLGEGCLPEELPVLCPALQVLDVSHNRWSKLPCWVIDVPQLRVLDVSHNRLTSAGCDAVLQKAMEEDRIPSMLALRELNLSNNRLASLPAMLVGTPRLNVLELAFNDIQISKDDEPLLELPSLRTLNLSNNRLDRVPKAVFSLPGLETLNVENNSIRNIPAPLGLLTQLRALFLNGNPQRTVRQAILGRGTPAILEYLDTRIPESERPRLVEKLEERRVEWQAQQLELQCEADQERRRQVERMEAAEEARLAARPGLWWKEEEDEELEASHGGDAGLRAPLVPPGPFRVIDQQQQAALRPTSARRRGNPEGSAPMFQPPRPTFPGPPAPAMVRDSEPPAAARPQTERRHLEQPALSLRDIAAQIDAIDRQLIQGGISQAKEYALKKEIARLRAHKVRIERELRR